MSMGRIDDLTRRYVRGEIEAPEAIGMIASIARGALCYDCENTGDCPSSPEARIVALRDALEEIMSPPDASRGCGDYGVCDLHEARWLAKTALHADDKAAR